ncbi:MAG: hypothetical protein HYX93_01050 [Chloroflexi bacterium]|nr:hypothetical protein [Chloroflexota bacterium]
MAEEVTQTVEEEPTTAEESAPETPQAPPEERIAELQAAVAERDARIAGLEEALRLREARIIELDGSLDEVEGFLRERDEELAAARAQLEQAVALYHSALLASEPDIPEELVKGATVTEIDASLAQARQMVERVRSQLEAQASQERVPLGAPARSAPNLSVLSPQEKILLGLRQR